MLKKALKILAIILGGLASLVALIYIGSNIIIAANSKSACKDFPIKNVRVKQSDYSELYHLSDSTVWYLDMFNNQLEILSDGWALYSVNTRVKDYNFTEDYFINGDNTDLLLCTTGTVYIKNGTAFPQLPCDQAVKSVIMHKTDGREYEVTTLDLTSDEAQALLEILCDENYIGMFDDLNHGQYIKNGSDVKKYSFFFDFNELDTINAEGVVYVMGYNISEEYRFATDADGNLYVVFNSQIKQIPTDLAEKLLPSII